MYNPKTTTDDYIFLIVTHECNKKCPFCVDLNRGKKQYITLENVWKAVKHCIDNNKKTITIVGGEPTLHPQIVDIVKIISMYNLEIVMTTNYSRPYIVKELDKYVNSFNISHYNQQELPHKKDFNADLTLSKLIFKGQLDTKEKLDNFIDKYQDNFDDMKFSTLTNINEFTNKVHNVSEFLDSLEYEKEIAVMNQIKGQYYRGYLVKRFDITVGNECDYKPSYKMHVNGKLSQEW